MTKTKSDDKKEYPMPAIRLSPAPPPPLGTRTWDKIHSNLNEQKNASDKSS